MSPSVGVGLGAVHLLTTYFAIADELPAMHQRDPLVGLRSSGAIDTPGPRGPQELSQVFRQLRGAHRCRGSAPGC